MTTLPENDWTIVSDDMNFIIGKKLKKGERKMTDVVLVNGEDIKTVYEATVSILGDVTLKETEVENKTTEVTQKHQEILQTEENVQNLASETLNNKNLTESYKNLAQAAQNAAEVSMQNAQVSSMAFELWSDLSAVLGAFEGQSAEVMGTDVGAHIDPVTSLSVNNSGKFSWTTLGWKRIGEGSSTKEYVNSGVVAAGTANVSKGAGYEVINLEVKGYAATAARQGVTVSPGAPGEVITVTKAATTGSSVLYGVYLRIPYDNISDLDKTFRLNAVSVSGTSFDTIRVLKNAADWNPIHAPIYPSLTDSLEGGAGFNIYDAIVASNYQSDYEGQNHLFVLLCEYDGTAANNDTKTGVWTIRPTFDSAEDVIANKITDALRNELEIDFESVVSGISRKASLSGIGATKNDGSSIATIEETYTYEFGGVSENIGYRATLNNVSGYSYTYAKLFDDYATEAADKKYRVYVRSNEKETTIYVRFTSGPAWGSVDGSTWQALGVFLTLNSDNGYKGYVDIDYADYAAFYAATNRNQVGYVILAYDGTMTPESVELSTYVYEITETVGADMKKGYLSSVEARMSVAEDEIDNLQADVTALQADVANYINCSGDSLTAGGGWTSRLATLSGLTVHNGGTGGENSKTIMARQGGDVMITNNITIPAGTTPVVIADRDVDGGISTALGNTVTPLLQGGSGHVNPCMIGDVEGTLAWTGSGYADTTGDWTFTRSTAGSEVVIDRPTAIRTNMDRNRNGGIQIIFMGQNGGYTDNADLIRQHRLMIEHSTAKHTVVLGLSSGSAASRAAYEAAMEAEFGRYFISLRAYLSTPIYDVDGTTILSCYGLDDAGLTPTQADLDAIVVGVVPPQMLTDSVHYTTSTKTVIGNMLYKKMRDLNLFV